RRRSWSASRWDGAGLVNVRSSSVVEDDPECGPLSIGDRGDAVAHPDAVVAVGSLVRSLGCRKDDAGALRGCQDMSAALRPRPLRDEDDLAALVVLVPLRKRDENLEGEIDVAVEILVKGVPVAFPVAEDQGRGSALSGRAAAVEELVVTERKGGAVATETF